MTRARTVRSKLLIVVSVLVVLIGSLVVAQASGVNSQTVQTRLTLQPRPHPKSHIRSTSP